MNDNNPQPEELAPLDAFEQQWVDQLAQREPDLKQTEDAFVRSVMQHAESQSGPTVVGRIGFTLLPYAAAAAIVVAAFIGWYVINDDPTDASNEQPIANETNNNATQPDDPPAVATTERPKVQLGKLIAQATTTNPTAELTNTVSEMPEKLNVDRLFHLLGDSVPDLKEILAPLQPKDEQSRA